MKRFLIIALVLMLVLAMLAVPAFADEIEMWEMNSNYDYLDSLPSAGEYELTIEFESAEDGIPVTTYSCIVTLKRGMVEAYEGHYEEGAYFDTISIPWSSEYSSGTFDLSLKIYPYVDIDMGLDCFEGCFKSTGLVNSSSLSINHAVLKPVLVSGEEAAVDSVFGVFTGIGSWLVAELGNATSLFYQADTGLTILGVLAVAGLGIAVVFLLINWIKSLLQFRK